jgi:hypothetical protein
MITNENQRRTRPTLTARQIYRILARHSHSEKMDRYLAQIEGFADHRRAVGDLKRYRYELGVWADGEANKRRASLDRDLEFFKAQGARKATAVVEGFGEFGIEPAGSTFEDFLKAKNHAGDFLEQRERDQRLLGKEIDRDTDPVVIAARVLWDGIDDVRELDDRVAKIQGSIDAVDPFEIDEQIVGYMDEYAAKGQMVQAGGTGRPVMDPGLESRIQALGMLDEPSHHLR